MELCFYEPGATSIVDVARPDGRSQVYGETLDAIRARYPNAQLIPLDEATRQANAILALKYAVGTPTEITEERWFYALEVLPPCRWERDRLYAGEDDLTGIPVERFYVSELLYGDVASWYVRVGRRCFEVNDSVFAPKAAMYAACLALTRKEPTP